MLHVYASVRVLESSASSVENIEYGDVKAFFMTEIMILLSLLCTLRKQILKAKSMYVS